MCDASPDCNTPVTKLLWPAVVKRFILRFDNPLAKANAGTDLLVVWHTTKNFGVDRECGSTVGPRLLQPISELPVFRQRLSAIGSQSHPSGF